MQLASKYHIYTKLGGRRRKQELGVQTVGCITVCVASITSGFQALLFISIVIVCPLGEWLELSGHLSSPSCLFTVHPGSRGKACELSQSPAAFTQALCLEAAKSGEEELGQGFMAKVVNRVRRSQF